MAQKATKQLAQRNARTLNRTHLITAAIHAIFIGRRMLLRWRRLEPRSVALYVLLGGPGLFLEFWLERIGRPSYVAGTRDVRRPGEDLEAKGLTEYMWDVIYWTWTCTLVAAAFGDRAWWLWVVVPLYSVWLAYTTYSGMRGGMGLLSKPQVGEADDGDTTSGRQRKMEKRRQQRVQVR